MDGLKAVATYDATKHVSKFTLLEFIWEIKDAAGHSVAGNPNGGTFIGLPNDVNNQTVEFPTFQGTGGEYHVHFTIKVYTWNPITLMPEFDNKVGPFKKKINGVTRVPYFKR